MIYVFLADGFEETEAIAPIDILKRFGKEVVTVGIGGGKVEMIVLPGGMPGTLNLEKSPVVQAAIKFCVDNKKAIGAICAAPSIIGKLGLLKGKKATCFPGFEQFLEGAMFTGDLVNIDDNIVTAKGAGAAVEFGLALGALLCGEGKAEKTAKSLQCR